MRLRFGLRIKLLLLSSFLFVIPWFGYQYVWEMEKYLRFGQEQTLIGTARALATSLHERPNLFNNQASFLPNVEKGKDLYGYELNNPIQLDGKLDDWPFFDTRSHLYNANNQISTNYPSEKITSSFNASVSKFDRYLYLFINVTDNIVSYRGKNARSIVNNDHIDIAFVDQNDKFNRYIISNKQSGWIDTYRITDIENDIPVPTSYIQGHWLETTTGYNVEIRIPLTKIGNRIAFTVNDIDLNKLSHGTKTIIGSADTRDESTLGTILVPSPEIERIVKGMSYTNSRLWVVDKHHRVLASAGDINSASGVWQTRANKAKPNNNWWDTFEQNYLIPIYYKVLTKPSKDFIDQLYDNSHLTGAHIESALKGEAKSQWRLTTDQKAVILSAAYPIFINEKVNGAVIVEETTNGIRSLRNRALEKLFTSILAILFFGTLAFLLFASRISNRIRTLRNQADLAIDEHGRIKEAFEQTTTDQTNDEIGDLSRSFATAISRLSQYNHYLENMSSRLSHELRTPIAVVRTSLENLNMQPLPDAANAYIERAQSGIHRLNYIITSMSEATRIEQMLQSTEKIKFNAITVTNGCIQGFKQIHPSKKFELSSSVDNANINGSPEHFAQLLDKILSNAVDFSSDDKVTVNVLEKKSAIQITVCNKGPLLPQQMEGRLFNSMVSVRDEEQSQPHLGLGLFIAKLICEFHHGDIKAENTPSLDGVIVTITLPTL